MPKENKEDISEEMAKEEKKPSDKEIVEAINKEGKDENDKEIINKKEEEQKPISNDEKEKKDDKKKKKKKKKNKKLNENPEENKDKEEPKEIKNIEISDENKKEKEKLPEEPNDKVLNIVDKKESDENKNKGDKNKKSNIFDNPLFKNLTQKLTNQFKDINKPKEKSAPTEIKEKEEKPISDEITKRADIIISKTKKKKPTKKPFVFSDEIEKDSIKVSPKEEIKDKEKQKDSYNKGEIEPKDIDNKEKIINVVVNKPDEAKEEKEKKKEEEPSDIDQILLRSKKTKKDKDSPNELESYDMQEINLLKGEDNLKDKKGPELIEAVNDKDKIPSNNNEEDIISKEIYAKDKTPEVENSEINEKEKENAELPSEIDIDPIYNNILIILKEKDKKVKKKHKKKILDLLKILKLIKENQDKNKSEEAKDVEENEEDITPDNSELKELYKNILDILTKSFNRIKNDNKQKLINILNEIEKSNKKAKNKKTEKITDNNDNDKDNKLKQIIQKVNKRYYLIYYFQKWKLSKLSSPKDNNQIDNLLSHVDKDDEDKFKDSQEILVKNKDTDFNKDIIKSKLKNIINNTNKHYYLNIYFYRWKKMKMPKTTDDINKDKEYGKINLIKLINMMTEKKKYNILYIYYNKWKNAYPVEAITQSEKEPEINSKKGKLIKVINTVNTKTKYYYLKIYLYKWKEIAKYSPQIEETILITTPEVLGDKDSKKTKNKNIVLLDQEEPVNRIIIQEEKDRNALDNRRRKLLRRIFHLIYLRRPFYLWYENAQKMESYKFTNSCLNGIYGYCYTEQFTYETYEYANIHANIESSQYYSSSDSMNPYFGDFLRNMNLSVAAFNLFTFYSQLHDLSLIRKKKYLAFWRKVCKSK